MKRAILSMALAVVGTVFSGSVSFAQAQLGSAPQATSDEWTTLSGSNARTGFNSVQTALTSANAASLHEVWSAGVTATIVSEPVIANGLVYFGSQDGWAHAIDLSGQPAWTAFVGQTTATCGTETTSAGAAATPTAYSTSSGSMLAIPGGDGRIYGLDALTGAVVWSTRIAQPPAGFLWGAPAVYGGSIYEGIASLQDCPLVRGGIVRLDAATGSFQKVRWTVPAGCQGGTIWSAPAIDESSGILYSTTGNSGSCGQPEVAASAMVAYRASDLGVLSVWQVPPDQLTNSDSDFGASPTLFEATIGGERRVLVGAANKNGRYYALDRTNLAAGPIWQKTIARSGEDPMRGDGSISTSAFDGSSLYIAGGSTTVVGKACAGSVRALDPASGLTRWIKCTPSPILAALSATAGLLMVSSGRIIGVLATADGSLLYSFIDPAPLTVFFGGVAISQGVLYFGNASGVIRALGPA